MIPAIICVPYKNPKFQPAPQGIRKGQVWLKMCSVSGLRLLCNLPCHFLVAIIGVIGPENRVLYEWCYSIVHFKLIKWQGTPNPHELGQGTYLPLPLSKVYLIQWHGISKKPSGRLWAWINHIKANCFLICKYDLQELDHPASIMVFT